MRISVAIDELLLCPAMTATGLATKREVIELCLRAVTKTSLYETSNMVPDNHATAVHAVLAAPLENTCNPERVRDRQARALAHVRGYARRRLREITQQQRWHKRILHTRRASPLTHLPVRRFSVQRTGFPYAQREDITRVP